MTRSVARRRRLTIGGALAALLVYAACYPNPDDLRGAAKDGGGGAAGDGGAAGAGTGGIAGGTAGKTGAIGTGGAPVIGIGGAPGTGGRFIGTGGTPGTGGIAPGTGGTSGTGGGAGGCPSTSPIACPSLGDVPARCWPERTVCSTVTNCNGTFGSCPSADGHYDCATNGCKTCNDAAHPVFCPSLGTVAASCWTPGTKCGTVTDCGGSNLTACTDTGMYVDCSTLSCKLCSDPGFPVACPLINGSTFHCWMAGTICSKITRCSDGSQHSCSSTAGNYDCASKQCIICTDLAHQEFCPALNDVPATCWNAGVCSTVVSCSGTYHNCLAANQRYDCAAMRCQ